ncbi:hypothetical protein M758_3G073300 [Ceratodon purpureus]|nr:hypothetical protein M758_3G073300 [Ceratodon purpureus]KAG0622117.1 hypothetical protein M758_3G073300 [Ceratodon purpureus]KAG0622118.1 hypothetical protein M758_3G073300 [Ceratodon purpureus]
MGQIISLVISSVASRRSGMVDWNQEQIYITQVTEAMEEMASKWNSASVGQGTGGHPVDVPDYLRIDPSRIKRVRPIGDVGASAEVYEAIWSRCPCAVKIFKSEYSREFVSIVQKELNYLIALRHPHVVRLMGLSDDSQRRCSIVMGLMRFMGLSRDDLQGRYIIVMELMSKSLRALMVSRMLEMACHCGPFKPSEALDIITKIALGMWFLHTKGVSHRDLKSANVMVQLDNGGDITEVKIVDFGASLNLDSNGVEAKSVVGTGFFMAPEILHLKTDKSKKPDLMAADVYSFAMTCCEILTGKLPFEDEISEGKLRFNEYNKVVEGLRPELPCNLDGTLMELIKSCWAHDPNDRPRFENICERLVGMSAKTTSEGVAPLSSSWQDDESRFSSSYQNDDQGSKQVSLNNIFYDLKDHPLTIIEHTDLKNPRRIGKLAPNSRVYEATWLGCTFAVKRFRIPIAGVDATGQAGELEFMISLSHPQIVQLVGVSFGPYQELMIVMELMDCSLRELITSRMQERTLPFDIHEAVLIIRKIALGMAFLHSRGVTHRDLKSHNVMVQKYPSQIINVKIVDFGVSQNLNKGGTHLSHSGVGAGFWRAPEMLPSREAKRSRALDLKAADVYSFSMTCYEVFSGKRPMSEYNLSARDYDRVIKGLRPTLPSDLLPKLKVLIEKCWHGQPDRRPNFDHICEEIEMIEQAL